MKTRPNLRHNAKGRGIDATQKVIIGGKPSFKGSKARRAIADACLEEMASAIVYKHDHEGKKSPVRRFLKLRDRQVVIHLKD